MDVRRSVSIWMAAAFCASLGLALSIVAIFGTERGVYVALAATARLAFLIFLACGRRRLPWLPFSGASFCACGSTPATRLGVCGCAICPPRDCCLPVRYRTRARPAYLRHFWRRRGLHLSSRASFHPADRRGARFPRRRPSRVRFAYLPGRVSAALQGRGGGGQATSSDWVGQWVRPPKCGELIVQNYDVVHTPMLVVMP